MDIGVQYSKDTSESKSLNSILENKYEVIRVQIQDKAVYVSLRTIGLVKSINLSFLSFSYR